jgi:hypothetical protein
MGVALSAGRQVAVASAHGAPGCSTVALGLGLVTAGGASVVVCELDPWGGELAPRLGLALEPGLGTLVTAARRAWDAGLIVEHSQLLAGDVRLLPGRPGRTGSCQVVVAVAKELPEVTRLAGMGGVWDLGRLDDTSPAWPAALACDVVVLVARPTAVSLAHLVPLADRLSEAGATVSVAVCGAGRVRGGYGRDEVAAALEGRGAWPLVGWLPDDPLGVAMLERGVARWASRSRLGRALRTLAEGLDGVADAAVGASP